MPDILLESLTKRYGRRRGIEGLNLSVERGELVGFLGPNGAGKSTTLRILVGLLRANGGSAQVLGMDAWRDRRRVLAEVGYLAGDVRLWRRFTARTTLRFLNQVRRRDLSVEWSRLLDRFEMDPEVSVREMSRGMRQKLGLMMALAHRPRLLILDEPTSGLDPIMQARLAEVLRERAADGATVLFSSHTLREVENLCDRVGIVRRGELVVDETLENLRCRARRRVLLRFTSPPPKELRVRGVTWHHTQGPVWTGELEGDSRALMEAALASGADDLTVETADLERLFHSYYQGASA